MSTIDPAHVSIPDELVDDLIVGLGLVEGSRQYDAAINAAEVTMRYHGRQYEKTMRELQHKAWTEGALAQGPFRNSPYGEYDLKLPSEWEEIDQTTVKEDL